MQQAERGVFDMRRGQPVHLSGPDGTMLATAVETMDDDHLRLITELTGSSPRLVLTGERACALGLGTDKDTAVSITLSTGVTTSEIAALAGAPVAALPAGLLRQHTTAAHTAEYGALEMAKAALLVPAVLCADVPRQPGEALRKRFEDGTFLCVPVAQATALNANPRSGVIRISEADVPLEDADHTRFVLFREHNGVLEHVAILIGEQEAWGDPVPVRIHSACLTGDLFGSLRCDCGEQLRSSVHSIAAEGGGVLLYMAQEGRGIGLANKLRAYGIQDQGLDTVDANRMLGFHDDERHYQAAIAMLEEIGVRRVKLFTNNPEKILALARGGIDVVERRPLHGSINRHNRLYLDTKARRAGHLLQGLLNRKRDIESSD